MDFRVLPPQRRPDIGLCHAGPYTRFGKRRPSIPYPVAQRATHLSSTDQAKPPSADRRQPRVLFGAALVARLRQGIKREDD